MASAASEFAESARLRPFHPQARCELAFALKQLGRVEETREELASAREVGPCKLDLR